MPTLRERLKRPETYLAIVAIVVLLAVADSFRAPGNQVTARIYVAGVRVYRIIGHPLLRGHVRCRYRPTCSEYSIEAVHAFGIRQGLRMTFRRINSCTRAVPMGTPDPVRIAGSGQHPGSQP